MLNRLHIFCLFLVVLVCSCRPAGHDTGIVESDLTEAQRDSLNFLLHHHYSVGYNFVSASDTLSLILQQPEEKLAGLPIDTFTLRARQRLVVADICILPTDSVDSVWLKLGTEDLFFGWVPERILLDNAIPDDPISQFISHFSNMHLLVALVIVCLLLTAMLFRWLLKQKAYIVHFRDIPSFYPSLLCILVAVAAAFYASIQNFAPDAWQTYYFDPTLNPFAVPSLLRYFLLTVWAMVIVGLAAVEDVRHQLPFGDAVLYLLGLVAVSAVLYILFSITTLYYVGYLLLILYIVAVILQYFHGTRPQWRCGNCGAKLHHKGTCPRCGAQNT